MEREKAASKYRHVDPYAKQLADVISEEMNNSTQMEMDPFDYYVSRIHAKLHRDPREFRRRFIQGYYALLEELENELKGEGK